MRSRAAIVREVGRLRLDEMSTRRHRLDDINSAFDDLLAGALVRGVIDFGIA